MILQITTPEDRLEAVTKVLRVIDNLHLANELYKETNSNTSIDSNILYDVIEAIYNDKPFTDDQILSCYSVIDELTIFHNVISKFKDIETTLPLEVDFLLFGLNSVEQTQLSKEQIFNFEDVISNNMYCNPFKNPDLIKRIENVKSCINKELAAY